VRQAELGRGVTPEIDLVVIHVALDEGARAATMRRPDNVVPDAVNRRAGAATGVPAFDFDLVIGGDGPDERID
jgi:hypothetical protein